MELKVSPGGSADLLAATLFIDTLEETRSDIQADQSWPEDSYGID